MSRSETQKYQCSTLIQEALIGLGWVDGELPIADDVEPISTSGCWLCWLNQPKVLDCLNALGRNQLQLLIDRGYQLYDHWPREASRNPERWLGHRWYLISPAARMALQGKLHAIASSQLGRGHRLLDRWAVLLDWAIREARRDSASVVVTEGTTFFESANSFAQAADVPTVQLRLGDQPTMVLWLIAQLSSAVSESPRLSTARMITSTSTSVIDVSPAISELSLDPMLADIALRDRISFALSDRISVLAIRSGGKIARLLEQRLRDDSFTEGSCFMALPRQRGIEVDWSDQMRWLDAGVVGYVVDVTCAMDQTRRRCQSESTHAEICTQQPCFSMQQWYQRQSAPSWNYLTHCTRGNSVAWPQESEVGFLRRIWLDGLSTTSDPFECLLHILDEGRLRGSNRLTRTGQPVVCLSQVPLPDLLNNRRFQKHLGRWDWEPYGILFSRSALPQSRPVTYGDTIHYDALPIEEQAFFQRSDSKVDWTWEREWRVLGDIDLLSLSSQCAIVFTKTKSEAQQAARVSKFPVMWTDDCT